MPDRASLDRLVLDHLPAALRFATRLTGDVNRAEDIVQESLLRVVRAWPRFREEASFRTWFFRIIIYAFRDHLRKRNLDTESLDDGAGELPDPREVGPVAQAIASELGAMIANEVSRLPPRQREVLVLTAYEGLSPREAANVLEIGEGNVHSTLSVARSQMKKRLAPYLKSMEK